MSITVSTDVFCDICRTSWIHGGVGNKVLARHARQLAKRAGWRRHLSPSRGKMLDICPDCVATWSIPPRQVFC